MVSNDEETPLLNGNGHANGHVNGNGHDTSSQSKKPSTLLSPLNRLLIAAILVTTSFCFTQVP